MAKVAIELIKELRAKTSAGMGLCKEALEVSEGDMEKAIEYVNERSDVVSRLHNETGAKIGLCKVAFEQAGKDFQKAIEIIKAKGWIDENAKRESMDSPANGIIESYVHGVDQKTVALVEITCTTDFAAKGELFKSFAHEVALHIAAMSPKYIAKEDIPSEVEKEMREAFEAEARVEGKPESIAKQVVEGKMKKFYQENCLLEQIALKDDSKTIQNLVDEIIGKVGEPVKIRRILCWKFGE